MSNARTQILDTATRLFYEQGLRAVGVDRIIAEAGVAKATLYKHFPSKDALIAAYVERRSEQALAALHARIDAHPADPLAAFDALEDWFAQPGFRGCAFINSVVELADPAHGGHRNADAHKRSVREAIARQLREHGCAQPDTLAREFLMLMDGAIVTALRESRPDAARDARRIAEILMRESIAQELRTPTR